jgi:hypothetical protein
MIQIRLLDKLRFEKIDADGDDSFANRYILRLANPDNPLLDLPAGVDIAFKKLVPPLVPDGRILYDYASMGTYELRIPQSKHNIEVLGLSGMYGGIPFTQRVAQMEIAGAQEFITGWLYVTGIIDNDVTIQFISAPVGSFVEDDNGEMVFKQSAYADMMDVFEEEFCSGEDPSDTHKECTGLYRRVWEYCGKPKDIGFKATADVADMYSNYSKFTGIDFVGLGDNADWTEGKEKMSLWQFFVSNWWWLYKRNGGGDTNAFCEHAFIMRGAAFASSTFTSAVDASVANLSSCGAGQLLDCTCNVIYLRNLIGALLRVLGIALKFEEYDFNVDKDNVPHKVVELSDGLAVEAMLWDVGVVVPALDADGSTHYPIRAVNDEVQHAGEDFNFSALRTQIEWRRQHVYTAKDFKYNSLSSLFEIYARLTNCAFVYTEAGMLAPSGNVYTYPCIEVFYIDPENRDVSALVVERGDVNKIDSRMFFDSSVKKISYVKHGNASYGNVCLQQVQGYEGNGDVLDISEDVGFTGTKLAVPTQGIMLFTQYYGTTAAVMGLDAGYSATLRTFNAQGTTDEDVVISKANYNLRSGSNAASTLKNVAAAPLFRLTNVENGGTDIERNEDIDVPLAVIIPKHIRSRESKQFVNIYSTLAGSPEVNINPHISTGLYVVRNFNDIKSTGIKNSTDYIRQYAAGVYLCAVLPFPDAFGEDRLKPFNWWIFYENVDCLKLTLRLPLVKMMQMLAAMRPDDYLQIDGFVGRWRIVEDANIKVDAAACKAEVSLKLYNYDNQIAVHRPDINAGEEEEYDFVVESMDILTIPNLVKFIASTYDQWLAVYAIKPQGSYIHQYVTGRHYASTVDFDWYCLSNLLPTFSGYDLIEYGGSSYRPRFPADGIALDHATPYLVRCGIDNSLINNTDVVNYGAVYVENGASGTEYKYDSLFYDSRMAVSKETVGSVEQVKIGGYYFPLSCKLRGVHSVHMPNNVINTLVAVAVEGAPLVILHLYSDYLTASDARPTMLTVNSDTSGELPMVITNMPTMDAGAPNSVLGSYPILAAGHKYIFWKMQNTVKAKEFSGYTIAAYEEVGAAQETIGTNAIARRQLFAYSEDTKRLYRYGLNEGDISETYLGIEPSIVDVKHVATFVDMYKGVLTRFIALANDHQVEVFRTNMAITRSTDTNMLAGKEIYGSSVFEYNAGTIVRLQACSHNGATEAGRGVYVFMTYEDIAPNSSQIKRLNIES